MTPLTYAYRYPSFPPQGGTVLRFATQGREINGSRPIEAIPLYAAVAEDEADIECIVASVADRIPYNFECDDLEVVVRATLSARQALASGTLTEGGDVEQAPGDSLSGPTGNAGDAQ